MQPFLGFRPRAKGTFCKGLQGEVIEDTSPWHGLLDIGRGAGRFVVRV